MDKVGSEFYANYDKGGKKVTNDMVLAMAGAWIGFGLFISVFLFRFMILEYFRKKPRKCNACEGIFPVTYSETGGNRCFPSLTKPRVYTCWFCLPSSDWRKKAYQNVTRVKVKT